MVRIHVLSLLKEASDLIAKMEESTIPNVPLGKPDSFDEYDQIKLNPICYYIPVGDGLYKPTMDKRIFCKYACIIYKNNPNISPQEFFEHCIKIGFQIYDLCLAMKISVKDFSSIRYAVSEQHIPPYLLGTFKMNFGKDCAWNPIVVAKEKEDQAYLKACFAETKQMLSKKEILPEIDKEVPKVVEEPPTEKKKAVVQEVPSKAPIKSKTGEILWEKEHGFTSDNGIRYKESVNFGCYNSARIYSDNELMPVCIFEKPLTKGKPICHLNKPAFIKWFKKIHGMDSFKQDSNFFQILKQNKIPVKAFLDCFGIASLNKYNQSEPSLRSDSKRTLNDAFGYVLFPIENSLGVTKRVVNATTYFDEKVFMKYLKDNVDEHSLAGVKSILPIINLLKFSVNSFLYWAGISWNMTLRDTNQSSKLEELNKKFGKPVFIIAKEKKKPVCIKKKEIEEIPKDLQMKKELRALLNTFPKYSFRNYDIFLDTVSKEMKCSSSVICNLLEIPETLKDSRIPRAVSITINIFAGKTITV